MGFENLCCVNRNRLECLHLDNFSFIINPKVYCLCTITTFFIVHRFIFIQTPFHSGGELSTPNLDLSNFI